MVYFIYHISGISAPLQAVLYGRQGGASPLVTLWVPPQTHSSITNPTISPAGMQESGPLPLSDPLVGEALIHSYWDRVS